MDFKQNYNNLLKRMKYSKTTGKVEHNNLTKSPLIPFRSRADRPDYSKGFKCILGEFARIELNKKWIDDFKMNEVIGDIVKNPQVYIEEGCDEYLEKILKEYLFNDNNELNILNPYLFLYIPLSQNYHATGEKEVALYLRDIFCQDNEKFVNFFKNNNSNHGFINLILNSIAPLNEDTRDVKYLPILKNIVELFDEDIMFALNHEKFLINNIDVILAYYYFFYTSQLILKVNNFYEESVGKIEKLYFLLDWESVSKNRKTITRGYNCLNTNLNNFAAKNSVVDQLNILFGGEYCLLGDIYNKYSQLSSENQEDFLHYLHKWVEVYHKARGYDDIELPCDFKELINILFEDLNGEKGIDNEIRTSRYPLNLRELCEVFFVKNRGRYSQVFNINRELLLAITALCVKDEKIKLNQLFVEYEKRGLYFDRYSKDEIEKFLTSLNLIDKKSDSGDAKYVKSIL